MKINSFALGLVGLLAAAPVYADYYTLGQTDYVGMDNFLGTQCSTGGKILIKCNCPSPVLGNYVTAYCDAQDAMPYDGCRLIGGEDTNNNYYCVDAAGDNVDICMMCQCNSNQSTSSWTTIGSNRVSRSVYTKSYSGYVCTSASSTEYGCAANYYKSAGTGASMTCTACPQSGTNAIGTTAVTTCCLPSGTSFSDTSGSGTYTSQCCYTS